MMQTSHKKTVASKFIILHNRSTTYYTEKNCHIHLLVVAYATDQQYTHSCVMWVCAKRDEYKIYCIYWFSWLV